MTITQFRGRMVDGTIDVDGGLDQVARTVSGEGIAVIRGAFQSEAVLQVRDAIMDWARVTPPLPHGTPVQNVNNDLNFHRIDGDPAKSAAPHIHHHFNFNRIDRLPDPLKNELLSTFETMRRLQNAVAGTSARFSPTDDPHKLRPQVIQYPAGGGFFAEHVHKLDPQRVGLILALSQRGIDHTDGAATFTIDGGRIDSSPVHDRGDILLFRYDVPHAVTAVDPNKKLDWNSAAGRWSMVLPYY
jgi:hypothetical protein